MNRLHATVLLAAAIAIPAGAQLASAGSIHRRSSHRTRSLWSDNTARDPGDVITIIIEEDSQIEDDSERTLEKKTSRSANAAGELNFRDILPLLKDEGFTFPEIAYASSSDTKHGGTTDYTKNRKLTDKITATVEDVLPNGNLVVLGRRRRKVDGNLQEVQVSGIVRPTDISFTNEVSSQRVADFYVVYTQAGQEKYFTDPGWLAKLMNIINPF
jgi:flagellar L-ring protein precursor FlgH